VEVFNLANRDNVVAMNGKFGTPNHPANPSPTFGQATGMGEPRSVPLGARFSLLMRRAALVLLGFPTVAALTIAAAASTPAAPVVRLGIDGLSNANVSIAAAGSGVVVTWAARGGESTDVYAAWSRDGGATFEKPVRVNDVPGDARASAEQSPRVAIGNGVHVAWSSRAGDMAVIRAASAPGPDHRFLPAASVHPDKLEGIRGWTSLAVDPRGALHVAWLDGRGDVAGPGSPAPSAGMKRHDTRQDIYQAVRAADGSLRETRIATDVCFCCKTAVAAGPDDLVYVAFRNIYPGSLRDIAVARSGDGGRTFSDPVRLSQDGWVLDGCPDDGPALALDAARVLHVAWPTQVSEKAGKGIFYSYSTDGGRTFAPRLRLDESGGAAHPQIAAGDGRAYVVWDEAAAGGPRTIRMRSIAAPKSTGGTATPGPATTLTTGAAATYPAVAATPDGAVVTWAETTGSQSTVVVARAGR
jgi:hypothetical protein